MSPRAFPGGFSAFRTAGRAAPVVTVPRTTPDAPRDTTCATSASSQEDVLDTRRRASRSRRAFVVRFGLHRVLPRT